MSSKNGHFNFDSKDVIYTTHFPGSPVVPGVFIIHSFINHLKQTTKLSIFTIDSFKFNKFSSPGKYEFKIKKENNSFACWMGRNNLTYAEGIISSCF